MNNLSFKATSVDYDMGFYILVCELNAYGKVGRIAKPIEFEMVEASPIGIYKEPTINLSYEDADKLFNALWDAGLRPKAEIKPNNEIRRLENHLADMQKLVFKGK